MCAKNKYRSLRGMEDVLPERSQQMEYVERTAREVFTSFNYGQIRTPHLEKTGVFTASIGEDTDIIEKEMYAFTDRSGDFIALRPEGTAPIVRAFIENLWKNTPDVYKLFYFGCMFRGERPQKGRMRQFRQLGAEVIGGKGPFIDAELILTLEIVLKRLGISGHRLILNSLGCRQDQDRYKKKLQEFLLERHEDLCDDCKRRTKSNVLRVLDCKRAGCKKIRKNAPEVSASLCGACCEHYDKLKEILGILDIEYVERKDLVRGLDYYTGPVFEAEHDELGAQSALAAGGRYDELSSRMGGPEVGACGYAIGLERLLLIIGDDKFPKSPEGILIIPQSEDLTVEAFKVAAFFWEKGIKCQIDHSGRSFKGQMRRANREARSFVIIVTEKDIRSGKVILKDMLNKGEQRLMSLQDASEEVVKLEGLAIYDGGK